MKGVSQFLEVTLIIVITVVVSLIVANFVMNTATQRTATVQNATRQKLQCQFGDMFIKNVTFDCNNNCFLGNPYLINATIENSGTMALDFERIQTRLTTGEEYTMYEVRDSTSAATIETHNFNSIFLSSSPVMPTETMHTHRAYSNDSNTVGLWHFDEGSGQSVADSGRNNSGTLGNTSAVDNDPSWLTSSSCKFNSCLNFTGVNQTVIVPFSQFLNITTNKITLETWIYLKASPTATDAMMIVGKTNSSSVGTDFTTIQDSIIYALYITQGPRARFVINNGTKQILQDSNPQLVDIGSSGLNQWIHVAGTYNGSIMKLYINGALSNTKNVEGNLTNQSTQQSTFIGAANSTIWFFNGSIDEVRISNFARSFNTTLNYTVNYPNLQTVALYNGTGTQIATSSASGNAYSNTIVVNTSDEYRVEATDTSGNKIEKWYPVKPGANLCVSRSKLEKVVVVAQNCPELFDAIPGNLVNFVRCG